MTKKDIESRMQKIMFSISALSEYAKAIAGKGSFAECNMENIEREIRAKLYRLKEDLTKE